MPPVASKTRIGIGLRSELSSDLVVQKPDILQCLEIAPENYLDTGGLRYRELCELSERYPIICHGLSLSLGSLQALDWEFLKKLKKFLKEFKAQWFSDHLCYSSAGGKYFYDLLPLPFCEEAVEHVAKKIQQVEDFLEIPFALENISYYAEPSAPQMREWEFLNAILERADCQLLLDINNIYVNSLNHHFDPYLYLQSLPYSRVLHTHVAGHKDLGDFVLDNHGAPVIDPVWDMLRYVLRQGPQPTIILERDNNIPPLNELLDEVRHLSRIVAESQEENAS